MRFCIIMIIAVLIVGAVGAGSAPTAPTAVEPLKIITTNFPLYDFTRRICREKAEVVLLLPPGAEAHSYRPTPRDVVRIHKADVFIYTGKYMEPWVEDMLQGVRDNNLIVVDTSQAVLPDLRGSEGQEPERHDQHVHHHAVDPHFWLDPVLAQKMVKYIAAATAGKDKKNREYYQKQAEAFCVELEQLDRTIRETLKHCKQRTVIYGGHFVFGYFSRQYNLEFVTPYKNFSPNAQPNPRNIARLIKIMKQLKTKVIFYEELVEPKVARAIAGETKAQMVLLHGAHNISRQEQQRQVTYLSIMYENLEKLKNGLDYQQ
ncbi:zinc ABC transporter substrate-binding protein [bacterium]|nr:zinc ABC transporter substrate-binding protein [bacterium]